jgi:hypothetical protein
MPKTTSQNKTNRKFRHRLALLRQNLQAGWSAFYRKKHGMLMALSEACAGEGFN